MKQSEIKRRVKNARSKVYTKSLEAEEPTKTYTTGYSDALSDVLLILDGLNPCCSRVDNVWEDEG